MQSSRKVDNKKMSVKEMKQEVIALLGTYGLLKQRKEFYKISLTKEELDFYRLVTKSFTILTKQEYEVLSMTYIDNEENLFDYIIRDKLCLSERTYYRIKDSGLRKLYKIIPTTLFNVS